MLFCYIPLKVFSIEVLGSYVLYNQHQILPIMRLIINLFKFRKFCPIRPERAEAPSPGHRPG